MDFLDFNNDGKVDTGEEFIGYQIYKDMTNNSQRRPSPTPRRSKPDGFNIFIACLIAFEILKAIASLIYR